MRYNEQDSNMTWRVSSSSPRFYRNPHFWFIVVLFIVGIIFHYPGQLAIWDWSERTSFLGLDRYTVERVYFLAPTIYAGFMFRMRGGIFALAAALVIMLPRVILLSASQTSAMLETIFVISIGAIVNLLFYVHRRKLEQAERTDALLKAEEQKWRSSFNALDDVMIIIDKDYNIENINNAGLMLIGMSKEEIIGSKCYKIMSGQDSWVNDCPCPLTLRTKRVESVDRYEELFGKHFSIKSSPILNEEGQVVKFVELRRDITERKKAEEMLSNIVDGSSIPLFVINRSHKVTHWNRAMEALTDISKEEVVGTDGQWRPFYTEKRPVLADLIVDDAAEDKINWLYEGRYNRSNLIEGAYEADGFFQRLGTEGKWLHFTASPIKDGTGILIGATETLQDVTELTKTQEALRQSESRFRDLFESALDAIWVHDFEGNILMANKAAAKLTGYSVEEMYQSNLRTFLTGGSLSLAREIKQKLMQHQSVDLTYEQTLTRKDGKKLICVIATNLVSSDGEPVAFQNIARDVTEERQMHENLRYYLREITRAQEEERKRIARELHDSTAQTLIALLHQLENFLSDKTKLPVREAKALWGFHERLRDILQEIRR
jgi:PAS domain S-box-containing protein